MTYCLALQVDDGIVLAADSRTNAGIDYVTVYDKMHVFEPMSDRIFVLLSAGNLATTQEIISAAHRDIDAADSTASLANVDFLFEAARYLGGLSLSVQQAHEPALTRSGVDGRTTLILGGQIAGNPPQIFLIYPQGNFIHATRQTPYLQIGESKYGKPMLDRLTRLSLSLEDAARLALVSLDATMRSNPTVGPPIDLAIYPTDTLRISHRMELGTETPLFQTLRRSWADGLGTAFRALPKFDWE